MVASYKLAIQPQLWQVLGLHKGHTEGSQYKSSWFPRPGPSIASATVGYRFFVSLHELSVIVVGSVL